MHDNHQYDNKKEVAYMEITLNQKHNIYKNKIMRKSKLEKEKQNRIEIYLILLITYIIKMC